MNVPVEHSVGQPAFLAWAAAGFCAELVHLTPPTDLGTSPGKKPTDTGWETLAVTQDIVARWARIPGNVGLRTKHFPAVDVDVDDLAIATEIEKLAAAVLGSTARRTRSNSARRALLFRLAGSPFKKKLLKFKLPDGTFSRVEILADGQQIAVAGLHPSGAPNEWVDGQPKAETLAPLTASQGDELLSLLRVRLAALGCVMEGEKNGATVAQRPAPRDLADGWEHDEPFVDAALRALDPDLDYERWIQVAMALHSKYPEPDGEGFNAWDSWSSAGNKYPGRGELEKKWRSFETSGGVKLGSLFALAGISVRELSRARQPTPEHTRSADVKPEVDPAEIPLVRAYDAIESPVDWVIDKFLARGELTDLSGDPGVGKGGITASWAAKVTNENPSATVIFFATEDPLGRVKARLRAEGADLKRIWFLDITRSDASPILPGDIGQVEAAIRKIGASFVVFDPALEFMAAQLDSHKQQDVARFMGPLLGIAMRTNAALLTVRHNNKNVGASALHRASGSIGFTGKVRIALTAAKNKDTGDRAIAMTKNNLGEDRFTQSYTIVKKDGASVVAWGEVLSITADELVNQEPMKKRGPNAAKLEAACDVLRSMLAGGPMHPEDVFRCAKAEGIGKTTVYEAKAALGVTKCTLEMRTGWRLPEKETPEHSG